LDIPSVTEETKRKVHEFLVKSYKKIGDEKNAKKI
jgi:hypothetical protein